MLSEFLPGPFTNMVVKTGAGQFMSCHISGLTSGAVVSFYDGANGKLLWSSGPMLIANQQSNLPFYHAMNGIIFYHALIVSQSGPSCNVMVEYI